MSKKEVKIIPLGGVEQIGMNCTAIEVNNEIIVIDAGLGFPEDRKTGIDYLIPNPAYLTKNKDKIKGIFITHAHLDHIGALNVFLKRLDYPELYAADFPIEIIKGRLKEDRMLDKVSITRYKEDDVFKFNEMKVTFFRVNHSTPDAHGIIVNTPLGNIVHTGDFKVDNSPEGENPINFQKLAKAGGGNVLALLSDSTNSFKKGLSTSESKITEILQEVVSNAPGRVIVATFSQLVVRVNQLLELAMKEKKKVSITGRSLKNTFNVAKNLGYIKVPDNLVMSLDRLTNLPKNKQIIFTTGHQAEEMAALSRMARDEHRFVDIQEGDTVIMSASVIPGNNLAVQKMIDALYQRGATVFHQGVMDLHAGGHGKQEDQKIMINLVKPKYFMPVHGYQSFIAKHANTAQQLGIPEENTIISENGKEIIFSENGWKFGKKHASKPIIISGKGVGDLDYRTIEEREQLGSSGVITISIESKKQKDGYDTTVYTRTKGFVNEKTHKDIIFKLKQISESTVKDLLDNGEHKGKIIESVENNVSRYVRKETGRNPIVLVDVFKN
jgi:ribonuclease J